MEIKTELNRLAASIQDAQKEIDDLRVVLNNASFYMNNVQALLNKPPATLKRVPEFSGGTCRYIFGGCISDPLAKETRHTVAKAQIDEMVQSGAFNLVQVLCSPWELAKRPIVVNNAAYNIFEYAIAQELWVMADGMEAFHPATSTNPNTKLTLAQFDAMMVELHKLRSVDGKPGLFGFMLDDCHRFQPAQVKAVTDSIRKNSDLPVFGTFEVYDKKNRDPKTGKDPLIDLKKYTMLSQSFLQTYRKGEVPAGNAVAHHIELVPTRAVHFEAYASGKNNKGLTSAADMREMFDALEKAGIEVYIVYAVEDENTHLATAPEQWSMVQAMGEDYRQKRGM